MYVSTSINAASQLAHSSGGMGNVFSCASSGALLMVSSASGDLQAAQEVRWRHA